MLDDLFRRKGNKPTPFAGSIRVDREAFWYEAMVGGHAFEVGPFETRDAAQASRIRMLSDPHTELKSIEGMTGRALRNSGQPRAR
jgi:hypothetical protein